MVQPGADGARCDVGHVLLAPEAAVVQPEAGDVRGGGGKVGEAVDVEEVARDGEGLVGYGGHCEVWRGCLVGVVVVMVVVVVVVC